METKEITLVQFAERFSAGEFATLKVVTCCIAVST